MIAKTTITMPEEDFRKVKDYCRDNDIKFSQLVRKGLKGILENEKL